MRVSGAKLLAVGIVAAALSAGELAAVCYRGRALATVFAGTGGYVTTSHFGEVTYKPASCLTYPMYLIAQTLMDGNVVATKTKNGGPGVLGAYMTYDPPPTPACSGGWRGTTEFGVGSGGIGSLTLGQATSGIKYAACPPPPPPCGSVYEGTSTWTVGPGGARLADHQLGFGLSRFEERPEGFYAFEEWAMLGVRESETRIRLSSAADFEERLAGAAELFRPAEKAARRMLVVEAGNHPHNSRHVPLPGLVPLRVDLGEAMRGYGRVEGEFWFRAEVAPTGEVDRTIILESSVRMAEGVLHHAIRENLELRFEGDKRHRAVVFGRAQVDGSGLLTVKDAGIVLPACCCGGQICY